MRRVCVAVVAWSLAWQALATDGVAPLPTTPAVILEEVFVEAREPRYVAPTLRDRIGRVWAPVFINGKGPFRLVLDTGATTSAITASVAERLGIPILASSTVKLHGATGSAVVPYITVDSLEIGDLIIGDSTLPILPDVFGGAEGVLGTKGLSDKRIYIDFSNDLIEITYSRGKQPPAGFSRLPFEVMRGRLATFKLQVGGVNTKAIIDTGAQQTVGNNSLREALVRRRREAKDSDIIGVTLDIAQGESILTPPIAMGDVEIRNLSVTFGDMFIFEQWQLTREPTLLIGMDVIGALDTFIIDYKRRELHLRARR